MSESEINPVSFSKKDFKILQCDIMYQGVFSLVRCRVQHRLFNQTWSEPFWRELFKRKSAVAVLPYDPVRDTVVLIQQFRLGAVEGTTNPWVIEIVAGVIDHEESREEVARREAQEEAGCEVLDLYPIYEYFVSPGGSNEYLSLFVGRVDARKATGIYGLSEEHEDILAVSMPLDQALQKLKKGEIQTSPAIISLQWLELNRDRLRATWLKK